jgi:hypothetical protein
MQRLVIDNNNVVELQRLRNSISGGPITDATVSLTVYDGAGVPVVGQIWPASMQHVSDGYYRTTLDSSLILRRGGTYYGIITADGSGGERGKWELQIKAEAGKVY